MSSIVRSSRNVASAAIAILLTAAASPTATAAGDEYDHSHRIFTALLMQNVNSGKVDYPGFIASKSRLQNYLETFAKVDRKSFSRWNRDQQIAFWINAYNAFTIKAIIDHYPIKPSLTTGLFQPDNSIRQIPGVWDKLEFAAAGRRLTLDQIEHEILRVDYTEPRVHFALVCASISCPDLHNEAYRATDLDAQLEQRTEAFLGDRSKGVQLDDDELVISQIFKWFPQDFANNASRSQFDDFSRKEAGVLGFILEHATSAPVIAVLRGGDFDVDYLDYDWSLNE